MPTDILSVLNNVLALRDFSKHKGIEKVSENGRNADLIGNYTGLDNRAEYVLSPRGVVDT